MKTTEQVRSEFVAKTRKATENNKLNMMLATCSPADKKALEMLAELDKASGGGLHRLMAIYMTIKQSS